MQGDTHFLSIESDRQLYVSFQKALYPDKFGKAVPFTLMEAFQDLSMLLQSLLQRPLPGQSNLMGQGDPSRQSIKGACLLEKLGEINQ